MPFLADLGRRGYAKRALPPRQAFLRPEKAGWRAGPALFFEVLHGRHRVPAGDGRRQERGVPFAPALPVFFMARSDIQKGGRARPFGMRYTVLNRKSDSSSRLSNSFFNPVLSDTRCSMRTAVPSILAMTSSGPG